MVSDDGAMVGLNTMERRVKLQTYGPGSVEVALFYVGCIFVYYVIHFAKKMRSTIRARREMNVKKEVNAKKATDANAINFLTEVARLSAMADHLRARSTNAMTESDVLFMIEWPSNIDAAIELRKKAAYYDARGRMFNEKARWLKRGMKK